MGFKPFVEQMGLDFFQDNKYLHTWLKMEYTTSSVTADYNSRLHGLDTENDPEDNHNHLLLQERRTCWPDVSE